MQWDVYFHCVVLCPLSMQLTQFTISQAKELFQGQSVTMEGDRDLQDFSIGIKVQDVSLLALPFFYSVAVWALGCVNK